MFDRVSGSVAGVLACSMAFAGSAAGQGPREECGLGTLIERLGEGSQPTGAGVVVAQVEVGTFDRYATGHWHPQLAGKSIQPLSGDSLPSPHATIVGLFFYGLESSLAPGIQRVDAYEVLHWLGPGFVNGSGPEPPSRLGVAIVNNSWVGDAGPSSNTYVRKIDWAVEEQRVSILGGTANGPGQLAYPLLTHGYNSIIVGRADGRHGAGETLGLVDGPGRMKPDLVAPAPASSFATPLVAGAAALLLQTAREHPALAASPGAERPDVIKAVLMAGATHRLGWSNGAPERGPARGATSRPLDPLFGADVVNVDRSHWILTAGEQHAADAYDAAPEVEHAGWAELEIGPGESRWLRLQVCAAKPFASVVATWHRRVHADFQGYDLPDVDLELHAVGPRGEPRSLVGEAGLAHFGSGNVLSESRVDNVEHLYVEHLQPGEYLLEVRRAPDALPAWTVALAWTIACAAPETYGEGRSSLFGQAPRLRARGLPARSAGSLELTVEGGQPGRFAILMQSDERAELPLAGGMLLLRPPLVHQVAVSEIDERGTARISIPITADMVGARRCYQARYSDASAAGGTGVVLTNAVEVLFCN